MRLKSTAKQPGLPLIFLAGGPGGSGIRQTRGPALPLFLALREVGDVILLDQRGTGLSRPVLDSTITWDLPLDKPGEPRLLLPLCKDRLRTAAREFTKQGVDLSAYNPAEVADDIESVRIAIGAKRVNLWGVSYGTYIALTTIRRHDESVHRAVLTSVVGPDQALLKRPTAIQEQLERVEAALREDPKAAKVLPDFLAGLRHLLEQLDKQPVSVELTDPRGGKAVQVVVGKWDLQFFLGNQIGRTFSLKSLPAFCTPLLRGDFQPLAKAARDFRRGPVGNLMAWQMLCASGVSEQRRAEIERTTDGTLLGNAVNFPFPEIGDALSLPDLGSALRAPLQSKTPVLFISGTLDGECPLADVSEIQGGFAKHSSLVVEGASHGFDLFYFAPGLKGHMIEFLSGGDFRARRITMTPFRFNPFKVD